MSDKKMFKWMALLIVAPIALAVFGGDRFRYPCQDPANWDSEICKPPKCEVTRTCPEHIFKGPDNAKVMANVKTVAEKPIVEKGAPSECGK
jgi:hypothetical protein